MLGSLIKVLILFALSLLISKFLLPRLFKFSAKTEELLFLSALTLLFIFSLIASLIGFSIVIGAFLAGLALGNLPYNFDIAGHVKPLRDFFVTIFFVTLGIGLTFNNLNQILYPLIIILLLLLIIKPIITAFFTSLFGYKERTSMLTGFSLFQVSEFSLILIAQGLLLGHISNNFFSLIVLVTVISMALTPYVINNQNWIYSKLKNMFLFLDKLPNHRERLEYNPSNTKKEIIILGCNRMGSILIKHLEKIKNKLLIIDHDPNIIKSLIEKRYPCIYGDITNKEVLDQINFRDAKIIISTVPELEHNIFLIKRIKKLNKNVLIFITADYKTHASDLYKAGADYVILPKYISGEFINNVLRNKSKIKTLIKSRRNKHIDYLANIEILGENHNPK